MVPFNVRCDGELLHLVYHEPVPRFERGLTAYETVVLPDYYYTGIKHIPAATCVETLGHSPP